MVTRANITHDNTAAKLEAESFQQLGQTVTQIGSLIAGAYKLVNSADYKLEQRNLKNILDSDAAVEKYLNESAAQIDTNNKIIRALKDDNLSEIATPGAPEAGTGIETATTSDAGVTELPTESTGGVTGTAVPETPTGGIRDPEVASTINKTKNEKLATSAVQLQDINASEPAQKAEPAIEAPRGPKTLPEVKDRPQIKTGGITGSSLKEYARGRGFTMKEATRLVETNNQIQEYIGMARETYGKEGPKFLRPSWDDIERDPAGAMESMRSQFKKWEGDNLQNMIDGSLAKVVQLPEFKAYDEAIKKGERPPISREGLKRIMIASVIESQGNKALNSKTGKPVGDHPEQGTSNGRALRFITTPEYDARLNQIIPIGDKTLFDADRKKENAKINAGNKAKASVRSETVRRRGEIRRTIDAVGKSVQDLDKQIKAKGFKLGEEKTTEEVKLANQRRKAEERVKILNGELSLIDKLGDVEKSDEMMILLRSDKPLTQDQFDDFTDVGLIPAAERLQKPGAGQGGQVGKVSEPSAKFNKEADGPAIIEFTMNPSNLDSVVLIDDTLYKVKTNPKTNSPGLVPAR